MRIVTSGSAFLDIDAYAGCVAYAELLNLTGVLAQAASSAPLNESVTQEIRSWTVPFTADYEPGLTDDFALIDISEAAFFDPIVDRVRVREVIDHHTGFEADWAALGDDATIEFIGAACTLVYEKWVAA